MMEENMIGVAVAAAAVVGATLFWAMSKGGKKETFLDKTRQQVTLVEKTMLSPDTFRFRFALPKATMVLGLPVGKHFKVFAPSPKGSTPCMWNGQDDPEQSKSEIERKYTPTTSDDDLGHVDLVIKVYSKGNTYKPPRERFPDGGKMSQYMGGLKVGDTLQIQGPFGHIEYLGKGVFNVSRKELPPVKEIGMVAGGTGITPMLQIAAAVLKDKEDTTKIYLLFCNQTEEDILVRDMLEGLKAENPSRFVLNYTLDRPPAGWKGHTGFVTQEMLTKTMPKASSDSCVLMCGPPVMVDKAVRPNLEAMGYGKTQIHAF